MADHRGLYAAYRNMYEALGVSNIDAILPPPPQPMPLNAAKENQNALLGQPLQAFPQQDHQAHIQAHLAMMTTPARSIKCKCCCYVTRTYSGTYRYIS